MLSERQNAIINLLGNSIIQIILFAILPFIWWLIFWRKKEPLSEWLGIKKINAENKIRFVIVFIAAFISLSLQVLIIPYISEIGNLAAYQFYDLGLKGLVPAFIYAFIQTGLSEELFFRGFLTKRLINRYGFQIGNVLQSLLFGFIHGVMIKSDIIGAFIVILSTGITTWLMGWLNEKEAKGSILPGWLLHGFLNFVSSVFMMFNLY